MQEYTFTFSEIKYKVMADDFKTGEILVLPDKTVVQVNSVYGNELTVTTRFVHYASRVD